MRAARVALLALVVAPAFAAAQGNPGTCNGKWLIQNRTLTVFTD